MSKLELLWVDRGYSGKNFASALQQVCGDRVRVEVLTKSEVPSSEVRSYFFNGNLSNSPKILRQLRRGFRPILF